MRRLSGQEIVRIWEVGQGQHPLDQAITILMSVYPEASHDTLALLSIGQRDACLFKAREQTFGQRLSSLAVCPACQEQIEFNAVLQRRDYAFCLFPEEKLRQLCQQFL